MQRGRFTIASSVAACPGADAREPKATSLAGFATIPRTSPAPGSWIRASIGLDERRKYSESRAVSAHPSDYVELRTRSAFSFLEATATPEELVECAVAQGHRALALADGQGVYGLPRFHRAARQQGLRPILGARVGLEDGFALQLLVESPRGWKNLCRLLTRGHASPAKGSFRLSWSALEDHAGGLTALVPGDNALQATTLDRTQAMLWRRKANWSSTKPALWSPAGVSFSTMQRP